MNIATAAVFVALVGGAVAAATIASRTLKIPYTVGLVIAGLVIGVSGHPTAVALTPNLVMFVFLPCLLFAGAWEMDLQLLRRYWIPIALLASVGVAIGIGLAVSLLRVFGGIDSRVAIIFGTLVAATDPVAVIALFRELRVDRSLATIVEGESLFNDGVAVVAFRVFVLGAIGGAGTFTIDPAHAIVSGAVTMSGGVLVGVAVGLAAALLLRNASSARLDVVVTALVAYGSYVLGESAHVSGIFAVIAAGLTCSGIRSAAGSTTDVTETVDRFWEGTAFFANSVLFVLVGLAIDLPSLARVGLATAAGVVAVVVARAAMVFFIGYVSSAAGRALPRSWQYVIGLGGLRGALSMALVLSLPESFQDRAQLIAMVYSVVLFTLVIQGLSLRPAIVALSLSQREPQG